MEKKKITVGESPPMFQVRRVFVLENQGLGTLAFRFTNFDEPDHVYGSQGGTEILILQGKPLCAKGPLC